MSAYTYSDPTQDRLNRVLRPAPQQLTPPRSFDSRTDINIDSGATLNASTGLDRAPVVSAADRASSQATSERNASLDQEARSRAIGYRPPMTPTPQDFLRQPTPRSASTYGPPPAIPDFSRPQVQQPDGPGLSQPPMGQQPMPGYENPAYAMPGYRPPGGPPPIMMPGPDGSYAPSSMPPGSTYKGNRYDPNFAAINGVRPNNPHADFIRQQLLAMNGTQDGRVYTPQTLARASDAQVQGELAALKQRNEFVNDQLRRKEGTAALNAGSADYTTAAGQIPAGVDAHLTQDSKTGRWLVNKTTPTRPETGFASAADAQNSIPKGSKGQVSQSANGRYVVQYQVGNDANPGPQSSIAKMQSDAAAAEKDGRHEDARALRAQIKQETSTNKPFSVREFQSQPDLMKQYGMSYGKYLADHNRLAAEADVTSNQPRAIKNQAEYNALPPGSPFTYNGKSGIKPAK